MVPKIISNILLTIYYFHSPSSLYFQITVYEDSAIARARKRSSTPTSDDDFYFSEDNYEGGKMP